MRGIALLAGALAAGFASTANAQDVDVTMLQMKACTLIKDDAARVRCYDQGLSRPASEPQLVAIPQSSDRGFEAPLVVIPQPPTTAKSDAVSEAPTVASPQSPATAKSESSSFFDMRTIMRAITPSVATTLTPSAVTKGENWQVKADKLPLQDASRLLGTMESADGKATLVLQCKEKNAGAYVLTNNFMGWESVRVRYRINDDPVTESRWAASADGRGAVASNAIEFINSLADGGTLFVRVSDYNGNDHDLRFSLGAVANLRSQIAVVCQWPGASPQEKLASEQTPPSAPNSKSKKPITPAAIGAPFKLH